MLKRITINLGALLTLLTLAFLAWTTLTTERYIESVERELNVALTENAWLERELSDTKEQLRISNDKLEKLAMKQESEKALELMEGDGE